MKISLKIDPETLFLLHGYYFQIRLTTATTMAQKADRSKAEELFQYLTRRCFAHTNNPTCKKLSFTLPYYQAFDIFEALLVILQKRVLNVYEANKLEMLKNELHQKLQ